MKILQASPLLQDFKLIERGSGNLPSKLYHLWENKVLSVEDTKKPILKGGKRRKRIGDGASGSGIATSKSLILDSNKDPLFNDYWYCIWYFVYIIIIAIRFVNYL